MSVPHRPNSARFVMIPIRWTRSHAAPPPTTPSTAPSAHSRARRRSETIMWWTGLLCRSGSVVAEPADERPEALLEPFELVQVLRRQAFESTRALGRELEAHLAVVVGIRDTGHEPRRLGAVDELHRAVVPQQQRV